jgi:hypothetical protein
MHEGITVLVSATDRTRLEAIVANSTYREPDHWTRQTGERHRAEGAASPDRAACPRITDVRNWHEA